MFSSTLKRSAAALAVTAGLLATGGTAGAAVVTDTKDPERAASVTCLDQDLNSLKQQAETTRRAGVTMLDQEGMPVVTYSLGRENSIEC
jgi:hypothetical protein